METLDVLETSNTVVSAISYGSGLSVTNESAVETVAKQPSPRPLGRRADSLSFLANALEDKEAELIWLGVDPRFDPICDEPIFRNTVRAVFPNIPFADQKTARSAQT